MQHKWKYIYLGWGIICVASGYASFAPQRTADFDMPLGFIAETLVFFCIAPLAITALRRRFGFETIFRRPSINRSPFNRRDVLQAYCLFVVSALLTVAGACLALPKADQNGLKMFLAGVAASLGLFIGEKLVYLVYAKEIAQSSNKPVAK